MARCGCYIRMYILYETGFRIGCRRKPGNGTEKVANNKKQVIRISNLEES